MQEEKAELLAQIEQLPERQRRIITRIAHDLIELVNGGAKKDDILGVGEAAELLGWQDDHSGREAVRRLIRQKKLPAVRVGKSYRITRGALAELVAGKKDAEPS